MAESNTAVSQRGAVRKKTPPEEKKRRGLSAAGQRYAKNFRQGGETPGVSAKGTKKRGSTGMGTHGRTVYFKRARRQNVEVTSRKGGSRKEKTKGPVPHLASGRCC